MLFHTKTIFKILLQYYNSNPSNSIGNQSIYHAEEPQVLSLTVTPINCVSKRLSFIKSENVLSPKGKVFRKTCGPIFCAVRLRARAISHAAS